MTGLADLSALGLGDAPGLDLLAGLDLAGLALRLQDEAIRRDQVRRLASRLYAEEVGFGLRAALDDFDEGACVVAEAQRAIALVRDFLRDVSTGPRPVAVAPPSDPRPGRRPRSPLRWLRRAPTTPEARPCA